MVLDLPKEIDLLRHPIDLILATREVYGLRMISGYTVGPIALLVWSVWRVWRLLPRPVQRHAQLAAAINIPLYLLFTDPGKLRDLSMLYITFLIVLAVNFARWIRESKTADFLQAGSELSPEPIPQEPVGP